MSRYLPRKNDYLGLFDDEDLFPDFFGENNSSLMRTDIHETDSAYNFEVNLPGVKKDNIKVSLDDGYLVIHAQYKNNVDEKEKRRYIRKERFEGSYTRSFYVGEDIKQNDIQAEFKDGVLNVSIPKKVEEKKQEKQYIDIK